MNVRRDGKKNFTLFHLKKILLNKVSDTVRRDLGLVTQKKEEREDENFSLNSFFLLLLANR